MNDDAMMKAETEARNSFGLFLIGYPGKYYRLSHAFSTCVTQLPAINCRLELKLPV